MKLLTAVAILPLAAVAAAGPADRREAGQARAAKVVLRAPTVDPTEAVRRAKVPPRLSAAAVRNLAIESGMPQTYSLTGTPTSLSARNMYVDGAAYLAAPHGLPFDTSSDNPYLLVTEDQTLMISFRTSKDNTLVLMAVHGATTGGAAQATLISYPNGGGAATITTTPPAAMMAFALQCVTAGWYRVWFGLDGAQGSYRVNRIDLSVFS